ncbi:MAG: hypothetical protein JWN83_2442 [Chitinophagaceae bacterium]|nr:hypothetical protein [Chitinophagaceae bacterium]
MTTADLTRLIFKRLKKFRFIILAAGLIVALLLYFYAKRTPVTFTSRATVFPLTSSPENTGSSNALSVLLGTDSKNFSDDASINIVELAQSRTTREAVAATVVPSMGNKTIAALLVEDINNHLSWMEDKVQPPPAQEQLIVWGGRVLQGGLTASINKNNMLVLTYTGRSENLVKVISYEFIYKISNFYIDLKREKAMRDYQFAEYKVDSLKRVLNAKDYQLIAIDKRTLFTNTSKLEFKVPVENLITEKQMVNSQYVQAVANRENAAYKLQKATPLIKVLDKPEPPYDSQTKSATMYGVLGFFLGSFLIAGLAIAGIILKFIRQEANKAIFGSSSKTTTTTATVS